MRVWVLLLSFLAREIQASLPAEIDPTVCSSGWLGFQGRCYYFSNSTTLTWSFANGECANTPSSQLVSINNANENAFIHNICKTNGFGGQETVKPECVGSNGKCKSNSAAPTMLPTIGPASINTGVCWIGAFRVQGSSQYLWVDGYSMSYTNYAPNQPNGNGGCLDIWNMNQSPGKWNDDNCETSYPFVCATTANCPIGYYKYLSYNPTSSTYPNGICKICPAGTYRDNSLPQSSCEQCDAGRMGDVGATTAQCHHECPVGFFCPQGTPNGGEEPCPAGKVGVLAGQAEEAIACQACPAGSYCEAGSTINETLPCPEGVCGFQGADSVACSGACPPGYFCPERSACPGPGSNEPAYSCGINENENVYCPAGSINPLQVPLGYYSTPESGGLNREGTTICAKGEYCILGVRFKCPPGTYGPSTGTSDISQCLACSAGSFCPEGSVSSHQENCAGSNETYPASFYCPEGTTSPQLVEDGYYTIPESSSIYTREGQAECPSSKVCVNGIAANVVTWDPVSCPTDAKGNMRAYVSIPEMTSVSSNHTFTAELHSGLSSSLYSLSYSLHSMVFHDEDNFPTCIPNTIAKNMDIFTVDSVTGVLGVTRTAAPDWLNFEACPPNVDIRYNVTVSVTVTNLTDSSTKTLDCPTTITVEDQNDNPTFPDVLVYRQILEKSVKDTPATICDSSGVSYGCPVAESGEPNIKAFDEDIGSTVTYEITPNFLDRPASPPFYFKIDKCSGIISLVESRALNFSDPTLPEDVNGNKVFHFQIVASDDGSGGQFSPLSVSQEVKIYIMNKNDPPTLEEGFRFTVYENFAAGQVLWPDAPGYWDEDGDTVRLLLDRNDAGAFEIENNTVRTSAIGSQVIDFEAGKSTFSIDIGAYDGNGGSVSHTYYIDVLNSNDKPTFVNSAAFYILENRDGLPVCRIETGECNGDPVITYDQDNIITDVTTYYLLDHTDLFAINETTGQISTLGGQVYDFENESISLPDGTGRGYNIQVVASSSGEGVDSIVRNATATISIYLVDENEEPFFSSFDIVVTVFENWPVGAYDAIGEIEAFDPDNVDVNLLGDDAPVQTLSYSISTTQDAGTTDGANFFSVSTSQSTGLGVVRVTSPLNYTNAFTDAEGCPTGTRCYQLYVRAEDNGGPQRRSVEQMITVVIININQAPKFYLNNVELTLSVDENSDIASTIALSGVLSAIDQDGDQPEYTAIGGTGDLLFDVTDFNDGNFEVFKKLGAVLNYEVSKTWTLRVKAGDQGGSSRIGTICKFVNGIPVDNCGTGGGAFCNALDERCYETCYPTNYISNDLPARQANLVDRELIYFCLYDPAEYPVSPKVPESNFVTFTINVQDVNDPPRIIDDTPNDFSSCLIQRSISAARENNTQIPIPALQVYDEDTNNLVPLGAEPFNFSRTIPGDTFWNTFELSNTALGTIGIYPILDGNGATDKPLTDGTLYAGSVNVTDSGGATSSCTIEIRVITQNTVPQLQDPGLIELSESAQVGDFVIESFGTLAQIDDDTNFGDVLQFSMPQNGFFAVNPTNGSVRLIAPIDYEAFFPSFTFSLVVQVKDSRNATDVMAVTVQLMDINESPYFTTSNPIPTYTLAENSPDGTPVGSNLSSFAADPDLFSGYSDYYTMSYFADMDSCGGNSTCPFIVDPVSGQITVASGGQAVLDYEATKNTWTFLVYITDNAGGQSAKKNIRINLSDVNEKPEFLQVNPTVTVPEGANGTILLNMATLVMDPDSSDPVSSLSFSLTGGSGMFGFSGTNLVSIQPLDYELEQQYTVQVTVSDSGSLFTVEDVIVNIQNVNDISVSSITIDGTASTTLNCSGGETIVITGTNFGLVNPINGVSEATVRVFYSYSHGILDSAVEYEANACSVTVANTEVRCTSVAGIGRLLRWRVEISVPTTDITADSVSPSLTYLTYDRPEITSITGSTLNSLYTGGGEQVVLTGTCLGDVSDSLTFSLSSLRDNFVSYCAAGNCQFASSCANTGTEEITCQTVPGLGTLLTWSATVGARQASLSYDAGAYGPPEVTNISVSVFPTNGQQSFIITGNNFGPSGSSPDEAYFVYDYTGTNSGSPESNEYSVHGCIVTTPFSSITCTGLDSGVGIDMPLFVTFASQTNPTSPHRDFASSTLTSISGPGAVSASTRGGQLVNLRGTNFGPACGTPGASVDDGLVPCEYVLARHTKNSLRVRDNTLLEYFPPCAVVSSTLIVCTTVPGTGAGHVWTLTVAEQVAPSIAGTTSYQSPTVGDYTDIGAIDALTSGNQSVVVIGSNMGPVDGAEIVAYYGDKDDPLQFYAGYCNVTLKHQEVRCYTSEGAGSSLSWTLFVDGLKSRSELTDYGPPEIFNFTGLPSTLNHNGGDVFIVNGRNFGPSGLPGPYLESVTYGPPGNPIVYSADCSVLSHTQLSCTSEAGVGTGLIMKMIVGNQESAGSIQKLNYASPLVTQLNPGSTESNGGSPSFITGSGFGICDPYATQTISFDGKLVSVSKYFDSSDNQFIPSVDCPIAGPDLFTLQFVTPERTGLSVVQTSVKLSSSRISQTFQSNTLTHVYDQPEIVNIVAEPGGSNGKLKVTVVGQNFCASEACCNVELDGVRANDILVHTHNTIKFQTTSVGQVVVVCLDGASEPKSFSTSNPFVIGTVPRLDQQTFPTRGTDPNTNVRMEVAIWGMFFGESSYPTILVGDVEAEVKDHISIPCNHPTAPLTAIEFNFDPSILCQKTTFYIPPSSGLLQPVVVKNGDAPSIADDPRFEFLSYNKPIISPTPVIPSDLGLHLFPTAGGDIITLSGTDFGLNGTVVIGGLEAVYVSWDHELASVAVPPGEGRLKSLVINANGQLSDPMVGVTLSYAPPHILSLRILGNVTNTQGGDVLEIHGTDLGRPYDRFCSSSVCSITGPVVTFGSFACSTIFSNTSFVHCLTPPGEGRNHVVLLSAGGQDAPETNFKVSYDPPAVYSVTPDQGPTSGKNADNSPYVVEVNGNNFGVDELQVFLNGTLVARRSAYDDNFNQFLSGTTHTKLRFNLPGGTGKGYFVKVIAKGQTSAQNSSAVFSYQKANITGVVINGVVVPINPGGSGRRLATTNFQDRFTLGAEGFGNWSSGGFVNCNVDLRQPDIFWETSMNMDYTGDYVRIKRFYREPDCIGVAMWEVTETGSITYEGRNSRFSCARSYHDDVTALNIVPLASTGLAILDIFCPCVSWQLSVGVDPTSCINSGQCEYFKGVGIPHTGYGSYVISEFTDIFFSKTVRAQAAYNALKNLNLPQKPDMTISIAHSPITPVLPTSGCEEWQDYFDYRSVVLNSLQNGGTLEIPRNCTTKVLVTLQGDNFGSNPLGQSGNLRVYLVDDANGVEFEASTTSAAGNHGQICTIAMGCKQDNDEITFWAPYGAGVSLRIKVDVDGQIAYAEDIVLNYAPPSFDTGTVAMTSQVAPGSIFVGNTGFQNARGDNLAIFALNLGAQNSNLEFLVNGRPCKVPAWQDGRNEQSGEPFASCEVPAGVAGVQDFYLCVNDQGVMKSAVITDGGILHAGDLSDINAWYPEIDTEIASTLQSFSIARCEGGTTYGRLGEVCEPCPVGADCSDGSFDGPKSIPGFFRDDVIVRSVDGSLTEFALKRCPPSRWDTSLLHDTPGLLLRDHCQNFITCQPKTSCLGSNNCDGGYQYAYQQCVAKRDEMDNSCSIKVNPVTGEYEGVHSDCREALPITESCLSTNPEKCSLCIVSFSGSNSTTPVGTCKCQQPSRCVMCSIGSHYRLNNDCVECPNNPILLIILFFLGAVACVIGAYVLSKKKVNLAFISIGVDYFQVLALFASSNISWPAFIQQFFALMSVFNFNIDITAPECLVPNLEYEKKWWLTMMLPVGGLAILFAIHFVVTFKKAIRHGARMKCFSHVSKLISIYILMFYYLYLSVTKRALDVFNCNPNDPDDGFLYTSFTSLKCDGGNLCRCNEEGGVQQSLVPYAAIFLVLYSLGFPAFVYGIIRKNYDLIVEDQYLRANDIGDTRKTNKDAYDIRKKYHLIYYHFKPNSVYWILIIILRKFCIAATSLMFRGNPSFQLSVALLVLFWSFVMQVRNKPFMSTSERLDVMRDLEKKADMSTEDVSLLKFRRLRKKIQQAVRHGQEEDRRNNHIKGRNVNSIWDVSKSSKNLVLVKSVKSKTAVGRGQQFFFDFNTVETVLLASAIIVCLAGIMFESGQFAQLEEVEYLRTEKDLITTITVGTIALTFIYYGLVFVNELAPQCFASVFARCLRDRQSQTDIDEMDKKIVLDTNPMFDKSDKEGKIRQGLENELSKLLKQLEAARRQNVELRDNLNKMQPSQPAEPSQVVPAGVPLGGDPPKF